MVMGYKKTAAVLIATLICFGMTSCSSSSNNTDDSSSAVSSSSSSSTSNSSSASSSNSDSSSVAETTKNKQGKLITKAAEFFKNKQYSFVEKLTDDEKNVTEITYIADGDNFYQLQQNKYGKSGVVRNNGYAYDFDYVCGIYAAATDIDGNIVANVVSDNLPKTSTHINAQLSEKYDAEEYTYVGDTYITVLDFYFSKKDGELKEYTVTYSIEGQDDITEKRVLSDMKSTITKKQKSLISTTPIKELVHFDNLSETDKQSYCQKICKKYDISNENISDGGLSDDKFKTISYKDFVTFVYKYGKIK